MVLSTIASTRRLTLYKPIQNATMFDPVVRNSMPNQSTRCLWKHAFSKTNSSRRRYSHRDMLPRFISESRLPKTSPTVARHHVAGEQKRLLSRETILSCFNRKWETPPQDGNAWKNLGREFFETVSARSLESSHGTHGFPSKNYPDLDPITTVFALG